MNFGSTRSLSGATGCPSSRVACLQERLLTSEGEATLSLTHWGGTTVVVVSVMAMCCLGLIACDGEPNSSGEQGSVQVQVQKECTTHGLYILPYHGSLSSPIHVYHRTPPYCQRNLHMLLSWTALWIIVARWGSYSTHSIPSATNFWILSVSLNHGGDQMFGAPPFQTGKQLQSLYR